MIASCNQNKISRSTKSNWNKSIKIKMIGYFNEVHPATSNQDKKWILKIDIIMKIGNPHAQCTSVILNKERV